VTEKNQERHADKTNLSKKINNSAADHQLKKKVRWLSDRNIFPKNVSTSIPAKFQDRYTNRSDDILADNSYRV